MKKITLKSLLKKKQNQEKIVSITAYDYTFARLFDQCDVDLILVGDSLSNVCAGYSSTLPITLDEMIYHCKAVRRGVQRAFLTGDLPFLSYQVSIEKAIENAGRMLQEAQVDAVKLEGGEIMAETIFRLTQIGIPVMGHLGFTPQSEFQIGRGLQGKEEDSAKKIFNEAKMLEEAGAFSIVLEMVPSKLAKEITGSLSIPTIGIGAGHYCDGQVLVSYDLLGLDQEFNPKFLKKYCDLSAIIPEAVNQYALEVKKGEYPDSTHSF